MASRPVERRAFVLFIGFWLPVLAYLTLIFTLSAQPHLRPPLSFAYSDKFWHLLEYGGLGLLVARALRASLRLDRPFHAALVALGFLVVVGASDEYFQSFVPGRDSSVFDFLADVTGGALAQVAYVRVLRDL